MTTESLPSSSALARHLARILVGTDTPPPAFDPLWPVLTDFTLACDLGPMLLYALRRSSIDVSRPVFVPLAEAEQKAVVRWMLMRDAQREINAALAHAAIPALWFKGIVLAAVLYPDPSLRPMIDIDLLVRLSQRESALRVLAELGFRPPDSPYHRDETIHKLTHHDVLIGGAGGALQVEMHFRLMRLEDSPAQSDRITGWAWDQRIAYEDDLFTFRPEAHLLYLCAHAILQHGEGEFYLPRFLDLHLLISTGRLDWTWVVTQAAALRWTYAVERALRITSDFFDTSIPNAVYAQLAARRPADENVIYAVRFSGEGVYAEKTIAQLRVLPLREKLSFILRNLFPSPSFMRERYLIAAGTALWPYYLRRWRQQQRHVWSLLRGRWRRRNQSYK